MRTRKLVWVGKSEPVRNEARKVRTRNNFLCFLKRYMQHGLGALLLWSALVPLSRSRKKKVRGAGFCILYCDDEPF